MMKWLVIAAAACGSSSAPTQDSQPPAPIQRDDAEAPARAVLAVLGRLDRAVQNNDPAIVAADLSPHYVELACGAVHRADARARIARGTASGWEIEVATDGSMAWAISTGSSIVHVEVLEHRTAWQLIASAVSSNDAATSGCDAKGDDVPELPIAPVLEAPLSTGAKLVWCGRWREGENGWAADSNNEKLTRELDSDRNGRADFLELGDDRGGISTAGEMAWRISTGSRFRALTVLQHRSDGWAIAASSWSPDPTTTARCTTDLVMRGRVVVTDTSIEILDVIVFEPGTDVLSPKSFKILDAVASTFTGNPGILRAAIQSRITDPKEPDPWELSERRGLTVQRYLRAHGVAAERLDVHYFGFTKERNSGIGFLILDRTD